MPKLSSTTTTSPYATSLSFTKRPTGSLACCVSCRIEPGASSSTSRIGRFTEPSCTVTFTFTSRTISRDFSSVRFGMRDFLQGKFAGELDGDAVGIKADGADKFWGAVQQHARIRANGWLHF